MGRSHKERRKLTGVSEEQEQKKIKENILKVFQARLSSPGQGGALLVAEPRQIVRRIPKCSNTRRSKPRAATVSSCTDVSSSESMSGRGRKRTKTLSLSRRKHHRKSSKNKKEVEKETAVSKHVRVAHGITGQQISLKNEARNRLNMLTHARVTQKVGLVHTGTKGAPASRGIQVVVPEHIRRKSEEGIKQMVREAEADVLSAGDLNVAETLVLCRGSAGSYARRSQTPASVDMRPQGSVCNSVDSVESLQSRPSPCDVDRFPDKLPLRETIQQLLPSLKEVTKNLYPGRDCLRETHDVLLKLVKLNAPRSATPTRLPMLNRITGSSSIQRSLMQSFTSDESHHHKERRDVNELVGVTDNEQNPIVVNEHAYSFDNHSSLVPKINFTDRNPFQTSKSGQALSGLQSVQSHSYSENNNLPMKSLGSFKKGREYLRKNLDLNKNMHRNVGDKSNEAENIPQSYNSSNVLGRETIQSEIKTYIDNHKYDSRRKVKNSDVLIQLKDEFSGMLGNVVSREHSKMENDFSESRKLTEDDYFVAGNRQHVSNSPQLPVFEGQAKLQMPASPMLNSEAKTLLQANDDVNKGVFEPMEIDLKGGEAVNLLERNDLLVNREEQHRYGQSDRNMQATMYDRSLERVDSRSNSQCSHCSQESSGHNSQIQVQTRQSSYMPSFHGNYYTDRMATGDLSWQQKNHRVKVEAMDILDYLDQHVSRDPYMDCHGDHTMALRAATPDSDGSPVWWAPESFACRKSVLPSPPKSPGGPKFYPKKMY